MERSTGLRLLLLSVFLVGLAILSYYWFDRQTNIHFQGNLCTTNKPAYVFSEKQIDPILATYKDLPTWEKINELCSIHCTDPDAYNTDPAAYNKVYDRLPQSRTFFSQVSAKAAIAETKTEPLCGSFYLSFPRKNLPKDDNLVFVADTNNKLWYRIVRIPEDVQSPELDLDSPKIVHNQVLYNQYNRAKKRNHVYK